MIVGHPAAQLFKKAELKPGKIVLEIRDLVFASAVPVTFALRQGELLGLVGLRGAGRENVGRALFGAEPFSGAVLLNGTVPELGSTQAAMQSGIVLIARDRAEESVAMALSLRENTFLNPSASDR